MKGIGPARAARAALARAFVGALALGAAVSCGSRTGLFAPETGASDVPEPGADASTRRDGQAPGEDGGPELDALPPIDAFIPPDVDRTDCPDADSTYVYVVTEQNELFSFYPPDLSFRFIGNLVCPADNGATPFSMAVDRKGLAYVVFTDGELFRVSTATAACTTTPYTSGQQGFTTFGMGFASDVGGAAEHLYLAQNEFSATSKGLGVLDTTTFALSFIGPFVPGLPRAELTGTGDGRLFAFWPEQTAGSSGSHIAEVDKDSAKVVARNDLAVGEPNDAFAFAFWGGDFYVFTSPEGESAVTRYRPADDSETMVTTHPSTIVGAGVSTCAPQL